MAEPPGSSSTATVHGTSQGASHGPTVNNKEQHPPYWNNDPCTRWLGPLNWAKPISMGAGRECRSTVEPDTMPCRWNTLRHAR